MRENRVSEIVLPSCEIEWPIVKTSLVMMPVPHRGVAAWTTTYDPAASRPKQIDLQWGDTFESVLGRMYAPNPPPSSSAGIRLWPGSNAGRVEHVERFLRPVTDEPEPPFDITYEALILVMDSGNRMSIELTSDGSFPLTISSDWGYVRGVYRMFEAMM